jgi:hypothetical protein
LTLFLGLAESLVDELITDLGCAQRPGGRDCQRTARYRAPVTGQQHLEAGEVGLGEVAAEPAAVVRASSPDKAQGLDGALRKLATTPMGPWLLVVVAPGLVIFGIYSLCEARWRKIQPG